ncbi:hypothetical protein ACJX0J_037858 [Zea mays]
MPGMMESGFHVFTGKRMNSETIIIGIVEQTVASKRDEIEAPQPKAVVCYIKKRFSLPLGKKDISHLQKGEVYSYLFMLQHLTNQLTNRIYSMTQASTILNNLNWEVVKGPTEFSRHVGPVCERAVFLVPVYILYIGIKKPKSKKCDKIIIIE